MKFGVSSYSFSAYQKLTGCDYVAMCHMAKDMGYDGIEFIDLLPEIGKKEDVFEIAADIRRACEELGLDIFAYTVGANFLCESGTDAEVERICRQVDVAGALGAPVMRHDATFSLPEGMSWEEGIAVMAPAIRRVSEYAKGKGIRTCTENHGYIYQAPARVRALIGAVDCDNFGWLFDMGNFSVVDACATDALPFARDRIFHVHAKDMILKAASDVAPVGFGKTPNGNFWRGTVLGHGNVPVVETVRTLQQWGYDGAISLEFEGIEDCLTALQYGIAYLKSMV